MTYFKFSTVFILLFLSFMQVNSQNSFKSDSIKVYKVIITLFDGMRKGDSCKVHTVFHDKARMYTSFRSKNEVQLLEEGKLDDFLKAVGTPHANVWDEKISNTIIQIDGSLAQVWTYYSFFIGDKFSHCGVDAFQLIKDKNMKWQIINLIDTRRVEDCITNK